MINVYTEHVSMSYTASNLLFLLIYIYKIIYSINNNINIDPQKKINNNNIGVIIIRKTRIFNVQSTNS